MKKVAVIGARAENGKGIGFHHARIYYELSREGYDIKLAGISRTTQDNADRAKMIFKDFIKQKFNDECDINAYGDYREMLEKEQPDIISICSPDQFHLVNLDEVIKHVYNSGAKDVKIMCEKPLATSDQIDWAKKMLIETKEKGIMFAENLQLASIRELLLSKEFDGVKYSELEELPTDVIWTTEGKKNGEIILDLCPHVFSLIKPKNGLAILENDEKSAWIESNLGYTNIKLMYTEPGSEKKREWRFYDTNTEIKHTFSYEWIKEKGGIEVKPYIVYKNNNCTEIPPPILIEDPLKSSIRRFVEGRPYVGAQKGLENLILVASVLK
jgi:hypothetical protein